MYCIKVAEVSGVYQAITLRTPAALSSAGTPGNVDGGGHIRIHHAWVNHTDDNALLLRVLRKIDDHHVYRRRARPVEINVAGGVGLGGDDAGNDHHFLGVAGGHVHEKSLGHFRWPQGVGGEQHVGGGEIQFTQLLLPRIAEYAGVVDQHIDLGVIGEVEGLPIALTPAVMAFSRSSPGVMVDRRPWVRSSAGMVRVSVRPWCGPDGRAGTLRREGRLTHCARFQPFRYLVHPLPQLVFGHLRTPDITLV